jgi:putative peptidoglycan lipid II flippase
MTRSAKPLRVGRTVAYITALTFLGQVLALGRESAIAAKFGAGALTDAFLLAILVPNAMMLLVQNGLLMAFIPIVAEAVANQSEENTKRVTSNLINCVMLIVAALSLVVVLSADRIVSVLAPTLTPEIHAVTVRMFQVLMLMTVLGAGAALLTGVLNVYRVFVTPAFFGLILNSVTIVGIILLADELSIDALVIATLVAYTLQMLLLIGSVHSIHKYQFIIDFKDPALRRVLRLALPVIFTLVLQQTIVFADRAIAAQLGVGNVAALNFAAKITLFIPPLLIGAISSIMLPELSHATAQGNWNYAWGTAKSVLRYMLFVAVPVGAVLFILRRPIIVLAFERGAFTAADTNLTDGPMGFYAITVVAVCSRELIVRFFYAARDTLTPLVSGGIRMAFNLALDIVLGRLMGVSGIALATAIAICIDVLIMVVVLLWRRQLPVRLSFSIKIGIATVTLCLISSLTYQFFTELWSPATGLIMALSLIIAVVSGGVGYWTTCVLLKIPESKTFMAAGIARIRSIGPRVLGGA